MTEAIHSTDPNQWGGGVSSASDALEFTKELKKWQECRYPIVRILVTTLEDGKQYPKDKEPEVSTARKHFGKEAEEKENRDAMRKLGQTENLKFVNIPSDQQYYIRIGAADDKDGFGNAFRRLRSPGHPNNHAEARNNLNGNTYRLRKPDIFPRIRVLLFQFFFSII